MTHHFQACGGHRAGVATLAIGLVFGASCARAAREPNANPADRLERGQLPATWYAGGAACVGTPAFRVHAYTGDFLILRQPACTNYEKPFLYLLFGTRRALLLDTGAGKINVADPIDSLVRDWATRHQLPPLALIVAHSHGHGDHVAGDSQFVGRAGVTLVGRDSASVRQFFGMQHWPTDAATIDLGGRVLDVLAIPGHQPASIALYDRRTGVLLTGDTFYPGRLYVRDPVAFVASIQRLVEFTRTRPAVHLLGTHIENTNVAFRDYPVGTVDQPAEHVLQLSRADLVTLDTALAGMRGTIVRRVLPDFTIWPNTP